MSFSRVFIILLIIAVSVGSLGATEKAPALASRDQVTSALNQVSLKPLAVFSMRGRSDPFMSFSLLTRTTAPELISINMLSLSGVIEMEGRAVAMFRDGGGMTYILKGTRLFGPEGQAVTGIEGAVSSSGQVYLQQGGRKVDYLSKRLSKRLESAASR